jgi:hypothetical protein
MEHCGTPDSMENMNKSSLKIYNKLDDGDDDNNNDKNNNNNVSSNVSVSNTILFTTRQ